MKSALPWAAGESFLSAAGSFLTTLVAARFVAPDELGLAAIAIAIAQVVQSLLLIAPMNAMIRARHMDGRTADAMLFSFMVLGCVSALICAAAAIPVARVYGHTELVPLIAAYGLGSLLQAAMSVPTALLTRKLRTRTLTLRTLWQKLATLLITGGAAIAGLGAWAIVGGSLAGLAVAAVVLLVGQGRRIRFYVSWNECAPTLRLGALIGLETIAGAVTPRAMALIFGRLQGIEALGLLHFGIRLIDELASILSMVVARTSLPFFSALRRQGLDDRKAFMQASHAIAAISAPALLGLAAVASDLIPLVFGQVWHPAVLAIQVIAAAWTLRFTRVLLPTVLLARGKQAPQIVMSWLGLGVGVSAVLVLGTLPFHWAVGSYAAPTVLVTVPLGAFFLARATNITAWDQLRCVWAPLASSVAMFFGLRYLGSHTFADLGAVERLALMIVLGALWYVAFSLIFDRKNWSDLIGHMRH
jgi:O-antigen/teichoic acid export membrane protein